MMVFVALILCLVFPLSMGWADELTVLDGHTGDVPPAEMMTRYLIKQACAALECRAAAYEQVETKEDCGAYQKRLKDFFARQLGEWPERTPLNARVVARETREGVRLEKVIYESRPGFFVTALLFLPVSAPPYPGVLVPCGHSANGKASEAYQRACIFLAKQGIAALIYDPIGQGERFQTLTEAGKGDIGGTVEHTLVGVGAILVGMNTATFRIWDGMRGIDYLLEREEIDPERIGCTGNSGGGTLTSYLMALDPRIKAAAPSCYLTSFRRLLETIGPQDAEQNIYGQVAFGMDHADYMIMHAPNPVLLCCATKDFFDISGTWASFREAKRFYTRMGCSERVDIIENDAEHGFNELQRTAMVRWMRRWLSGIDDAVTEAPCTVLTDEEAQCTPGGQVLLLDGARSVWDLLADRETHLAAERKAFWANTHREKVMDAVRGIAGIRPLSELPEPEVVEGEQVRRDGYRIRKLVLKPEEGVFLPGLLFAPHTASGEPVLYLHGEGKQVDATVDGPISRLVKEGRTVFAVDLRGIGETESSTGGKGWEPYFASDWPDFFRAYLLGKSYVGMRAEDVLVCARFLANYRTKDAASAVHVVGIGEAAVPALHAAALEPDLFESVRLDQMVTSWADVVRTPRSRNQLINSVHGALAVYDLPDLVRLLPADKVSITNPLTPEGKPIQ